VNRKEHWETVYRTKRVTEVSWHQAEAALSARLIQETEPERSAPIIDVGGGVSVLVSRLDAAGYSNLTVLDVSGTAIALAQAALGARAERIRWIEADVLEASLPPAGFRFWHDRAVFHFLTDPADRAAYVARARGALAPGGHLLLSTFADDGPTRCSGLDTVRYSPSALQAELGPGFAIVSAHREEHRTPSGVMQAFTYVLCRRDEAVAAGR
jgi:SAM-dependent methyltransferase